MPVTMQKQDTYLMTIFKRLDSLPCIADIIINADGTTETHCDRPAYIDGRCKQHHDQHWYREGQPRVTARRDYGQWQASEHATLIPDSADVD